MSSMGRRGLSRWVSLQRGTVKGAERRDDAAAGILDCKYKADHTMLAEFLYVCMYVHLIFVGHCTI